MKKLNLSKRRLDRDPAYAALYYKETQRFIDNGYVEKILGVIVTPRVSYLPHFRVQNPCKPGKIRLVFDAA